MKKNIIFTLFGIMCATGAVTTDSIAACDECPTGGLTHTSTITGEAPWEDNSSTNGAHADKLVFWENCNMHEDNEISYYKCNTTNDGKCIYGRATVYPTGAYPARIDDTVDEHLICCDASTSGTPKWKQITPTTNWTGKDTNGCAEVIAAGTCLNNSNAPIFRAGEYFSSTSCSDTAADENTEEQSPSETYTRPANCPASANTCLRNVYTNATLLFANAQYATTAWSSNARISSPEQRVMYWQNCGTRCFESYGCQTDLNGTQLNHGKFIYAPLRDDREGAYTYKIIGRNDTNRLADQYKLLYCDASQNKWIKLTKANATYDTSNYTQITLGNKTLYVSATENITERTLWSTERNAPTEDEEDNSEEDLERPDEEEVEECGDDAEKIQAINSAMAILNTFKYTDDTSVWTTAEGKFNTARLGTDIASGIAMGLTGGLVSNVIIKNKQVKQGIQGYQCTVGSEVIADYGDEFIVNLAY